MAGRPFRSSFKLSTRKHLGELLKRDGECPFSGYIKTGEALLRPSGLGAIASGLRMAALNSHCPSPRLGTAIDREFAARASTLVFPLATRGIVGNPRCETRRPIL